MGEGPRGSNGTRSTLHWISATPSATQNQTGPLWCWFLSRWACARPRPLWVSPMTSPVRLGVSPAATPTPTGVFNQRFEALFPCAGALGCEVSFAPHCLSGFSVLKSGAAGCASGRPACSVGPTLRQSGSAIATRVLSIPAAHLRPSYRSGWMFIFHFPSVRLPCRSIFSQFWLCEEAQCVYLRRHLGSPPSFFLNLLKIVLWLTHTLSWRMFYVLLRTCILLLLDWVFCICLLVY